MLDIALPSSTDNEDVPSSSMVNSPFGRQLMQSLASKARDFGVLIERASKHMASYMIILCLVWCWLICSVLKNNNQMRSLLEF